MMIQNVVSFLPIFIEKNDWTSLDDYKLNENDVSLILSVFSVAQIIFAPFNGSIKNYLGTKNTILAGFFLVTLATFGLGLIAKIHNPFWFKYIAVGLRFFQG